MSKRNRGALSENHRPMSWLDFNSRPLTREAWRLAIDQGASPWDIGSHCLNLPVQDDAHRLMQDGDL